MDSWAEYTFEYWKDALPAGWHNLFLWLLKKIDDIRPKGFEILTVKEKYGGIRIYAINSSEVIGNMIDELELRSWLTCQNCGNIGEQTRIRGWVYTLCQDCQDDLMKKLIKYD